jgi:hypothetical protein
MMVALFPIGQFGLLLPVLRWRQRDNNLNLKTSQEKKGHSVSFSTFYLV